MSLSVRKESGTVYNPVFLKILEDQVGGVMVVSNRAPSDVKEIKAGTLLKMSPNTTGYTHFIKTVKAARTHSAATAMSYALEEPVLFKVNEYLCMENGVTASTITRILASAGTLWIATTAAIGALSTAGVFAFQASTASLAATGATSRLFDPDAILKNNIRVREDDLTTLYNVTAGAVVRGTLDESVLPYSVSTRDKTKLTDRIRFA